MSDLNTLSINQQYWLNSLHDKHYRLLHAIPTRPTRDMLLKMVLLEATYKTMLELIAQEQEEERRVAHTLLLFKGSPLSKARLFPKHIEAE